MSVASARARMPRSIRRIRPVSASHSGRKGTLNAAMYQDLSACLPRSARMKAAGCGTEKAVYVATS